MKISIKHKAVKSSIGIVIAILMLFSSGLRLPIVDDETDVFFNEAIAKAGVAYATCRVLNASVSIIKESTLQLEPAGVGVSLAVGQVLDPIDDMTEHLSDVLVTAITSLGVQKLAYEICVSLAPPAISIFLIVLSALIWFENERLISLRKTAMRFVLLVVIARLCLPLSSMANEFINEHFFADQISDAKTELALGSAEIDKLKDFALPKIDGVLGTIENSASFLSQKATDFETALAAFAGNMGEMIKNLLALTFLYVGVFLIQVIILPLLSFWFLAKTANAVFQTNNPVILRHPQYYESEIANKIKPVDV